MNTKLTTIIKQAIDIHVHIGPEILPRKYTVPTLVTSERGKIGGFVLKNHFYPTTPFIKPVDTKGLKVIGSVALNNAVGGLNPEAIYGASLLSENPIMVWFPTISAKNFLGNSDYEIAPEWVQDTAFKARKSTDVKPVLLKSKTVDEVLKMIKSRNAVLATGHISWRESVRLIEKALRLGIDKIVVTHPIYQKIDMPIEVQKNLAKKGCFMEISYSMYSIDSISIKEITDQIRAVGANSVILSSDVGQPFSPSPSKALYLFGELLLRENISLEALYTMFVINPKKLLTID